MWSDNETNVDFLNFGSVARTVSRIIVDAGGAPLSIGVSGSWGVGKSSMIKLIRHQLEQNNGDERTYVFVEFNAWLYQGYDDARAALMDVIARTLLAEEDERKPATKRLQELLGRINWLRAARVTVGTAAALAVGLPPVGLIGEIYDAGTAALSDGTTREEIEKAGEVADKAGAEGKKLIKPTPSKSPPKEIEAIRDGFEKALDEMGITLVVLIDDLDRCLPETAISTLEAIRLFLFLRSTAFVVAADTKMIRYAVQKHFEGVDDVLVTNYFDKLIQIPIKIPELGIQDIRAYLSLLYIEKSALSAAQKETLRERVCQELADSWKGGRVDRGFIQKLASELGMTLPTELLGRLDIAARLAPLMSSSPAIGANPRLVKRFLNAVSIRMAIAEAHGVSLDEGAVAKMLLLERCADAKVYSDIAASSAADATGRPTILQEHEANIAEGKEPELKDHWDTPFTLAWLRDPPRLADMDLRGVLFVSREHAPLMTSEDRLSTEGMELLSALLKTPEMAESVKERVGALPREERAQILHRLLDDAKQVQEWSAPPILSACIVAARGDDILGGSLAAFLSDRPANQIKAAIVPKIKDEAWAAQTFAVWKTKAGIAQPVKSAIAATTGANGNV